MNNLVLVRGARQLITLRGPRQARRGSLLRELHIIPDGALLIRDGIIVDIGPARRVERLAAARQAHEIDATGRVVMPAFVDAMARVAFVHAPSTATDNNRALKAIPKLRLQTRCQTLLEDMLRHGTATAEVSSGSGLPNAAEIKILRTYQELQSRPVDLIPTYTPCESHAAEEPLLQTIAQRKLARFISVRCAPGAFNAHTARKLLLMARRLGLQLKLQAPAHTPDEVISLAVEFGVSSISHLDFISTADTELLAGSTVIATLCPGTAYQARAARFAPARALIDAGAAVSLASGFDAVGSPFYSMPFVLSLACRHLRMTAAEAITAATVNSAYAAGCGARIGSLEPDKQAHLIVCNAQDYREIPHFAGSNPIHIAMKGSVVYQAASAGIR